jgi:hypothetical protein
MKTIPLFLLFGCLTQNTMNDILIENIKESYLNNESFQVTLSNKTANTLFYYISIECYINEEWREVINDITNPISKSSKISKINSNETKDVSFAIDNVLNDFTQKFYIYRLKINYGNKADKIDKLLFSKSFKILKWNKR